MSDSLNVPNKNFRILVVDDEKDLRQYYTTVLSRIEGTEIFTASTLEEAVQIVKEKNPFLLVQDIELYQNKNGWDIIEEIRTFNKDLKIFILSAYLYHGLEDESLLIKYNISHALKKPLSPSTFKEYVTSILFDQDFSIKPKRTEESLIQGRIHIKKVLHKLTNELSIIISECDMSQMRFETESYIKKDKEVAVEAAKIFERVAKDLRGLSKEMDTAEI